MLNLFQHPTVSRTYLSAVAQAGKTLKRVQGDRSGFLRDHQFWVKCFSLKGEIRKLSLLEKAGTILIPKRVDIELLIVDLLWEKEKPHWISIRELPRSEITNATA